MLLYHGSNLSVEEPLITLKTSKLVDQVCLKSEKALSLLSFIKSYEARGDTVG